MKKIKTLSKKQKVGVLIGIILLILVPFTLWILTPYPADPIYLDKVYSNNQLEVTESSSFYTIKPLDSVVDKAILFYPGGLVSADAYHFLLSDIAIQTKQTIYIVKFPLSLAVTNIEAGDNVIEAHPEVETWTIMGHSLGGSMACRYTKSNPEVIDVLVMLASYCDQSIGDLDTSVLTIYGSLNNGITQDSFEEFAKNLPEDATFEMIEGMNHAQFGNYGPQRGDNEASISNDEATIQAREYIINFIEERSL